jgi:hypothetical protein
VKVIWVALSFATTLPFASMRVPETVVIVAPPSAGIVV